MYKRQAQTDVEDLAANAGVPVWNGLTTEWHPTQMLADVLTMQENFNYDLKGRTVAVSYTHLDVYKRQALY